MTYSDPAIALEITAGLVLHLDPAALAQHGATPSSAMAKVAMGSHFFLCYAADTQRSWWTPLYTKRSTTRIELSRWGRTGHEKFTGARFEYDPDQHWVASLEAINSAAIAGRDRSRAGARNRVAVDQLPTLPHQATMPEPAIFPAPAAPQVDATSASDSDPVKD